MTSQLHYPELVSSLLKTLNGEIMPLIEIEESRIVGCATMLAEKFIREKKDQHARFRNDPAHAGDPSFSPLVLSARHINGSLQITWKEIHLIKNKTGEGRWKKRVHIPKGSTGSYNIASLQKSAGYSAELVERYESSARELRKRWQQLMALKKDIYAAIWRLPAVASDPLQGDIPAGQASAEPTAIDTLVPKPAPEPVLSPDKPRHRPSPAPSGPRPRRM